MRADLLVIGAGIAGLSTTLEAVKAGLKVVCIDPRGAGRGATSRSAGIATVQMEKPEDVRLSLRGVEKLEEWSREFGFTAVRRTGLVSVDWSDEVVADASMLRSLGVDARIYDGREAQELWPWLVLDENLSALYTGADLSVEPDVLASQMASAAESLGAAMINASVQAVRSGGGSVEVELSGGSTVRADRAVIAAGSWSKNLLAGLGVGYKPTIIKCPLVVVEASIDGGMPAFSDEVFMSYWRLRADGRLVGGGYDAWLVQSGDDALGELPEGYAERASGLLAKRVRFSFRVVGGWTGPCSFPEDFDPVLGPLPGYENVLLFEGLRGYGLARSPALAEILVGYLLGRSSIPGWLLPSRFLR